MTQYFNFWVYTQNNQSTTLKRYMHPMFIKTFFTFTKIWMQPKCPSTDEWIKMWCVYMYLYICVCVCMWCVYIYTYLHTMEYYSAIKRMKICHILM